MFEKEAEEYIKANNLEWELECHRTSPIGEVEQAFQKGAEFGYNFAKEEIDYLNKHWRSKEERNANEWYYPSKGEYPECDEKTQLIFYVNCYYEIDGETITRKRTVLGYYRNSFLNDDIKLFVEKSKGYEDEHLPKDVIAWKEIVLPKESE